jgi:DNA-binding transcriptional LysR family regulator
VALVNARKSFASTSYHLTNRPIKTDNRLLTPVEVRRLKLLLELSRLGSMRAVADELGYTTSTVSQQLGVLAQEAGATLIEPDGRRVRLTPAGQRLADHAVTVLAAVDAARLDLDPSAEPRGTVRVAGFATAMRRSLLPLVDRLRTDHPKVLLRIREHEPDESFALLADDDVDLALVYDYNLAPVAFDPALDVTRLWSVRWALGIPSSARRSTPKGANAVALFQALAGSPWIVNSRNVADEQVVRTIASMAGLQPEIAHHVDSLELVQELIA